MRYSVPVNAASEVRALVEAGADELYCGVQDAWWVARYGDHDSASRRQGSANLATFDELAATVRAASDCGTPVQLALNARYTEPQLDHLVALAKRFESCGGQGVIASDLGLIWRLAHETGLRLSLSILAVAQNTVTLRAFRDLGVERVVLPRFVEPAEAQELLRAVPGIDAGVMAFFDKCPLVDGYCRHRHGVGYPDRPVAGGIDDAPPLCTFDTTYRTHACLGTRCDYLEPYPCAACFLPQFEAAGVGFAKLGGRGRPLGERLRALAFLRQAAYLADDSQRSALYRRTFGRACARYFGAGTQSREAIEPVRLAAGEGDRRFVGSQTSAAAFLRDCERLLHEGAPAGTEGLTLLVPPLRERDLRGFLELLPRLLHCVPPGTHIAVNDLGTLVALVSADGFPPHVQVVLGTLLARLDDPSEVEHFLSPGQNPARPIYDTEGNPRMLVYAPPPAELVEHWRTPSATQPSAQQAIASLTGGQTFPYTM